jgi:hypothetical protein
VAEGGPGDAEVSASMGRLADAFITGTAEEGHHFDYAVENATRLDALVDLFRRGEPADDVVHSMTLSMGAYVGELIVRNGPACQGEVRPAVMNALVCLDVKLSVQPPTAERCPPADSQLSGGRR